MSDRKDFAYSGQVVVLPEVCTLDCWWKKGKWQLINLSATKNPVEEGQNKLPNVYGWL